VEADGKLKSFQPSVGFGRATAESDATGQGPEGAVGAYCSDDLANVIVATVPRSQPMTAASVGTLRWRLIFTNAAGPLIADMFGRTTKPDIGSYHYHKT
jgi:hypothetical protein